MLEQARPPGPADGFDVVPLYARLSSAEQHRVFERHGRRRVVLATNVAETSLTVPGIRYVVDAGLARISRYSVRTKVQRLPIEPISQASANQRAGRCGRVEAGICIRLYSEEDFESPTGVHRPRDPAHQPGVGDPADDRARPRRRRHGSRSSTRPTSATSRPASSCWRSSGAPWRRRRTARPTLGRQLVALPVDPRLARMVVEAEQRGCLREVLVDHRGAVAAGPARAAGRAAGAGRPAARPLQGPDLGLPDLAEPLALRAHPAARALAPARSAGCAGRSSSTTCGSASGRSWRPSCGRSPSSSS